MLAPAREKIGHIGVGIVIDRSLPSIREQQSARGAAAGAQEAHFSGPSAWKLDVCLGPEGRDLPWRRPILCRGGRRRERRPQPPRPAGQAHQPMRSLRCRRNGGNAIGEERQAWSRERPDPAVPAILSNDPPIA